MTNQANTVSVDDLQRLGDRRNAVLYLISAALTLFLRLPDEEYQEPSPS